MTGRFAPSTARSTIGARDHSWRRQVRRRRRHATLYQWYDVVPRRAGSDEGSQPGRPGEKPLDAGRHRVEVRPYCCPTASLIEIDDDGQTVSHKWFMISGHDADGDQTGTVEEIDFTDATPRWKMVGNILQPLSTTKAVLLPDGKVLIGQGVNRSPDCTVDGRPCTFEEKEGHHFQMFDPANGSITKLAKTTVSRGLHGTATLLPDASVFFAGENREALVRPDDPSFPLMSSYAGCCRAGIRIWVFRSGSSSPRLSVQSRTAAVVAARDRQRAGRDYLRRALRRHGCG